MKRSLSETLALIQGYYNSENLVFPVSPPEKHDNAFPTGFLVSLDFPQFLGDTELGLWRSRGLVGSACPLVVKLVLSRKSQQRPKMTLQSSF